MAHNQILPQYTVCLCFGKLWANETRLNAEKKFWKAQILFTFGLAKVRAQGKKPQASYFV